MHLVFPTYGWKFKISQILNLRSLNDWLCFHNLKTNPGSYNNLPNSAIWGWLSNESQPQNPEFRINPENFYPCLYFLCTKSEIFKAYNTVRSVDWKLLHTPNNLTLFLLAVTFVFCRKGHKTFANSLDPDQDGQNVGPDLNTNRLTLWRYSPKSFLKTLILEKNQMTK